MSRESRASSQAGGSAVCELTRAAGRPGDAVFSELAARLSFLRQTLEIPRAGKATGRKVLAVRKQVLDVGLELNPGRRSGS